MLPARPAPLLIPLLALLACQGPAPMGMPTLTDTGGVAPGSDSGPEPSRDAGRDVREAPDTGAKSPADTGGEVSLDAAPDAAPDSGPPDAGTDIGPHDTGSDAGDAGDAGDADDAGEDVGNPPFECTEEECNGVDDDCDGEVDEGMPDADGDGIPDCTDENNTPVANAGEDQVVEEREAVSLDGGGSFDPDGDNLFFNWRMIRRPEGSEALLEDARTPEPWFRTDRPGEHVIELVVLDGTDASEPDLVTVTAIDVPEPPVARASAVEAAFVGLAMPLDGSPSSDPDGDELLFAWTLMERPQGSAAAIEDPVAAVTGLTPDLPGRYVAHLTVSDGELEGGPAVVDITTTNRPPVARASDDARVEIGIPHRLDGRASDDPDGDLITWLWSFRFRPPGSAAAFDDPALAAPTTTLDEPGTYILRLTVTDPAGLQTADDVELRTENRPPVAVIADDMLVEVWEVVWLDGLNSDDPDGDELSYAWALIEQPEGSTAALSAPQRRRVWFEADLSGLYRVELVVSDDELESPAAVIEVLANAAPTAEAGPDLAGHVGRRLVLDGSDSVDPDDYPEPLAHVWRFLGRPQASALTDDDIDDRFQASAALIPDVSGVYTLELEVTDGRASDSDSMTITAADLPDLAMEIRQAPRAAHPQAPMHVDTRITNRGRVAAVATNAAVLLRRTLDGRTWRIAEAPVQGLQPFQAADVTIPIPAMGRGFAPGAGYELLARADWHGSLDEGDEANNEDARPFEVVWGDFDFDIILATEAQIEVGSATVRYVAHFDADSVADPPNPVDQLGADDFDVRLFLEDGAGTVWGSVDALGHNGFEVELTMELDGPVPPGLDYNLVLEFDPQDLLDEEDEGNNRIELPFEVVASNFRLALSESTAVQTASGEVAARFQLTFEAASQAEPPRDLTGILLGTVGHALVLIDERTGEERRLAEDEGFRPEPGESVDVELAPGLPRGLPPHAEWRLEVRVDEDGAWPDAGDEDNLASAPFEVLLGNLVPTQRSLPVADVEGGTLDVDYDVVFEAESAADPPNDLSDVYAGGYRRSVVLVDTETGEETALHSEFRLGAPPGESTRRTVRPLLPRPTAPGAGYRLELRVDTRDALEEASDEDNVIVLDFEVLRGDLTASITESPASAAAGAAILVRFGMRYDGPSAADPPTDLSGVALPAFVRRVLLRDTRDGSETSLADRTSAGEVPNVDETGFFNTLVPDDATPGDHYELVVRLDEDDDLVETDDTNNEASAALEVLP